MTSIADVLKTIGLSDSVTSAFRKEFRVNNTIGGPINKLLDYVSLQSKVTLKVKLCLASKEQSVVELNYGCIWTPDQTYLLSK